MRPSLVVQMVKNLPAGQETRVQTLGQEDPLEKGMAIHSSIPAWRIPWTEEPGGLQSTWSQRVGQDWVTSLSLSLSNLQKKKWCCRKVVICQMSRHLILRLPTSEVLVLDFRELSCWDGFFKIQKVKSTEKDRKVPEVYHWLQAWELTR